MDLWDSVMSHAGELKKRVVGGKKVKGPPALPPNFVQHCLAPKEFDFFDKVSW